MNHGIFATLFYIPLYNALIFLISVLPGQSAGLAVVLLTVLVRLILFPLSRQSIITQLQMRKIEPQVQKIRETVKDKQEQTKQLMALYKERDINPFAGLFLVLLQLPIVIALYRVFRSTLPHVDPQLLYSFVHVPSVVTMSFLGISLLNKSLILAVATVITQYIQLNLALPKTQKPKNSSFQNDLAHNLNMQMKYIFPLIIFPIAYISAVIALYLSTSNIFMILQELFVRRKLERQFGSHAIDD